MQKREHSGHKLPRIPSGDGSLSSKLFNLTGLRVFQAKFIQDIKHPRPPSRQSQNKSTLTPVKTPPSNQFTGQDTLNQMPTTPLKLEKTSALELKKAAKVKAKCMRPRGLKNLGNTCFMNAILQTLFSLEEFNIALEKDLQAKKSAKGVSAAYCRLVKAFRGCSERQVLNPSYFKTAIGQKNDRFSGYSQQDSQQLLTAFLEAINEETTRIATKPKYKELTGDPTKQSIKQMAQQWWNYFLTRDNSVIVDHFQGQLHSTISCSLCKGQSASFDAFWGMPVSLNGKSRTLGQLLNHTYGAESHLEQYRCQKCKKTNHCTRKTKIYRLPNYLVIQLKRFVFGWNSKKKLKDRIDIPSQFSPKSILSEDSPEKSPIIYKLKSTVEHSGELNFGHYFGHVYSEKDEKWFLANDQSISSQEVPLDSSKLYLLVYEKA